MKRIARYTLLLLLLLGVGRAFCQSVDEYQLKAAFVYNFTKFIEWNNVSSDNGFVIGIIGSSPLVEPMTAVARVKTVKGSRIILRQFNSIDNIGFCHAIFIPKNSPFGLNEIMAKVAAKGTLVISERGGYANEGAAINFVNINNTIKFEVNRKSIKAASLTISSQLLRLAIIVD